MSRNRIVMVNSGFIQRPHKRNRGNHLIHRRFTLIQKKIDWQKFRQAGRQLWWMTGWCLELRRRWM